jgi:hypothetical protein
MAMHALSRSVVVCLSLCLLAAPLQAGKQPIRNLTVDPQAPTVDLFEAIEEGTVETTVIPQSANEANLFVTNNSSAAVSVKIPQAVVAVQVLKQFFPQGGRNQGPQGGNMTGQGQPLGGGAQNGIGNGVGNGIGNGIGNGPGNGFANNNGPVGFFSVPSHKTVRVPLKTVCLAHGKSEPRPRMKYRLVKLEDYTNDPALQETLKLVATSDSDLASVQAAVWHFTDKMSWKELREKQIDQLGGLGAVPYFTDKQIEAAEALVHRLREKTKESPKRRESAAN